MKELNINSFREYKKWHKRTKQINLPSNPQRHYSEWVSYCDFFNTDIINLMSMGEKRIYDYLIRKNIEFIYQKQFDDCKNIKPLPFDFYLPKYNLIIEFDGEQHYNSANAFNFESFESIQKHDKIKNQYCADNNINIIRILYHELADNTIEWTLDNEITKIAADIAISKT
jgi:very-short-patch-repair endonuclease